MRKKLPEEERIKRIKESMKRYRERNREYLRQQNKYYNQLWKTTKPFVNECKDCGRLFNANRLSICICPDCHERRHLIAEANKAEKQAKSEAYRQARKEYRDKVFMLRQRGLTQTEIAEILGTSQSHVSITLRR